MGPFADRYCPAFSGDQLTEFEDLLELPDPDLYGWIVGAIDTPPEYDGEVLKLLKAFKPHG